MKTRHVRLGVGILGIRTRARQFGGDLKIQSGPQGTRLHVVVPATDADQAFRSKRKSSQLARQIAEVSQRCDVGHVPNSSQWRSISASRSYEESGLPNSFRRAIPHAENEVAVRTSETPHQRCMAAEVRLQLHPLMFSVRHNSSLTLGGDKRLCQQIRHRKRKISTFQTVCRQVQTPINHRLIIDVPPTCQSEARAVGIRACGLAGQALANFRLLKTNFSNQRKIRRKTN